MNPTTAEYVQMLARTAKHRPAPSPDAAQRETGKAGLHAQIVEWCNAQWPPVKFIQARSDKKSGIAVGAQDFTLFLSGGRTVCVECKAKDGKLTQEQNIWAKEMEMLGHTVYLVRSMADLFEVVKIERTE